jgi:hypothetical protein
VRRVSQAGRPARGQAGPRLLQLPRRRRLVTRAV